jgi:MFS family permease
LALFQDGNIVWEKTTQGMILGSFFWGYLATQIPGGWVAARFGGKRVLGLGMAICSLCTFVTPLAAQTSYIFLMVVRVLMGIASVCHEIFIFFFCLDTAIKQYLKFSLLKNDISTQGLVTKFLSSQNVTPLCSI